ncbi:DNA repair protein RecO [Patescibacteria group bacterium]|nr:DNA repair protein RecO [Patescibacteria group bacterium]
MKKYNTQAIVLKSTKFRDADKIFTLYTKDEGKISAIARGVRKISSRRAGNLDSLNVISVKISESKGGFKNIDEVKTLQSFKELKKDLETSKRAYFILELVHKTVEEGEKDERLYDLIIRSLKLLSTPRCNPDLAVVYFEIVFMKELGYQLDFENCVKCQKEIFSSISRKYAFNISRGGFVCGDCSGSGFPVSEDLVSWMGKIWKGDLKLKEKDLIKEIDSLLKRYIDLKLESRFKSLEI